MNKILVLTITTMLAMGNAAFASEGVALSDNQMDEVAAGDWLIMEDDSGKTVEDIYAFDNTLKIPDVVQENLQAVSNVIAFDSAVAVQSSIASLIGHDPMKGSVDSHNLAYVLNYNPSESGAFSFKKSSSSSFSNGKNSNEDLAFNKNSSEHSDSQSSELETQDSFDTITAASASAEASQKDCDKDCEGSSVSASASTRDYKEISDYDKTEQEHKSGRKNSSGSTVGKGNSAEKSSGSQAAGSEGSGSSRRNLSENNHLSVVDNSQRFIQAVSNLNALSSAAASQANVASNFGGGGSISGSSSATVGNGL